jgi:hypothetical protein
MSRHVSLALLFALLGCLALPSAAVAYDHPIMSDLVGINIHAASIKDSGHAGTAPAQYRPTTSLVRDYHNFGFDMSRSNDTPNFPYTDNTGWINWNDLYGSYTDLGYRINACIQFNGYHDLSNWHDPAADAKAYGRAFAMAFGPTHGSGVVDTVQIGNEPGSKMSDSLFHTVFENMAEGIREIEPNLKIVTPYVKVGGGNNYAKDIALFSDITHLVDAYAAHPYPFVETWPTYERSFPENPAQPMLSDMDALIAWRNANDPSAKAWVTEFGYDATTAPNDTSGGMKDWTDVTDTQQAQWLTRGFLNYSSMDMDRAYMFWYNDSNLASVHGSSGLTRNWQPKPSFHAQAHLQEMLGDYRFSEVIRQDGDAYVFAYVNPEHPTDQMWVLWSPTGENAERMITLDLPGTPGWAERMPLTAGGGEQVSFEFLDADTIEMLINESPTYLAVQEGPPPIPGDANRDGAVTDADYTIWADHYGQVNTLWETGDFDGSGIVTNADYTIWADHYGSTASSVPEPGFGLILVLLGAGAMRRR